MASAIKDETAIRSAPTWGLAGAVLGLVVAFVGFFIGGQILFGLDQHLYNHDQLAFGMISEQFLAISVAAVAVYLAFVRYRVGAAGLGFRFPGWRPLLIALGAIPLIFLGILLISVFFSALFPHFLKGNAQEELIPHGQHIGTGERIVAAIWASIEAPLVEETLFRGIIYQGFREFCTRWLSFRWSVAVAAVASGLLFGLAHGQLQTLPILVFVGIALALVFQHARSIYASFLVHGIFNFIAVYSVFH